MRKKNSAACPLCHNIHVHSVADALKTQATTAGKLQRLIAELKPQQLAFRPGEGQWSIKEIVTHLADAELVYGFRYRKILAEDAAEAPAFDQELWISRLSAPQRDFKAILEMFKTVRRSNLDLLKVTPAKNLQRAGAHPEYGPLTVAQLMIHLAVHDLNHLKQLRRVRQQLRAGG